MFKQKFARLVVATGLTGLVAVANAHGAVVQAAPAGAAPDGLAFTGTQADRLAELAAALLATGAALVASTRRPRRARRR